LAYRINARFKDDWSDGLLTDVISAQTPKCGETILVSRHGREVPVRVTAVWTPSSKLPSKNANGLIMVEASET